MSLKITVKYVPKASAFLGRVSANIRNTERLLEAIGDRAIYAMQKGILSQKSPDDQPYEGWSKGYSNRTGIILYDSGDMFKSIDKKVSPNRVGIGPRLNKKYVKYIQEGTRKMKARPFVGISKDEHDNIQKTIDIWTETLLGRGYMPFEIGTGFEY